MATAKQILSAPPRRRARSAMVLLALAGLIAAAWFWRPVHDYAATGASYGARIGCACRFVQGRDIAACRADFESGITLVTLSEDANTKSVSAAFPLLSRQTAFYRPGEGCVLEKWEN